MASRGLMANPLEFKVVSPIKNGIQVGLQDGLSILRLSISKQVDINFTI